MWEEIGHSVQTVGHEILRWSVLDTLKWVAAAAAALDPDNRSGASNIFFPLHGRIASTVNIFGLIFQDYILFIGPWNRVFLQNSINELWTDTYILYYRYFKHIHILPMTYRHTSRWVDIYRYPGTKRIEWKKAKAFDLIIRTRCKRNI
jgi:hypothetical protein